MRLSFSLLQELESKYQAYLVSISPEGNPCAVFQSPHSDVGELEVYDDGDEITISLPGFTHSHFGNYDDKLTRAEQSKQIAKEVLEFLDGVFGDRIVFFGSAAGGGGWHRRDEGPRGMISKMMFGKNSYVCSGPLPGF